MSSLFIRLHLRLRSFSRVHPLFAIKKPPVRKAKAPLPTAYSDILRIRPGAAGRPLTFYYKDSAANVKSIQNICLLFWRTSFQKDRAGRFGAARFLKSCLIDVYLIEITCPKLRDLPLRELCPLLLFRELVTDLAGSKAALRAEAEVLERHILCSLVNACDDGVFILKLRALGRNQSQNDFLPGDERSALKPPERASSNPDNRHRHFRT